MMLKIKVLGISALWAHYCDRDTTVGADEILHPVYIGTPDVGVDITKLYLYKVVGGKLKLKSSEEREATEKTRRVGKLKLEKILTLRNKRDEKVTKELHKLLGNKLVQIDNELAVKIGLVESAITEAEINNISEE